MTGPDFLYIGSPRTGSVWLWQNLRRHPQVWVPPCKNIGYFHPRFETYRVRKFRRLWREMFGASEDAAWYRRFFGRRRPDDRWYARLFLKGVAGEIAESYCSLEASDVDRVRAVNPRLKVIVTLRNPLDRAISQAKFGLATRRGRHLEDITVDEMLQHIAHPSSRARSESSRALDLWESRFPDQVLVLFYDDFVANPAGHLSKVCSFLGVGFERSYFGGSLAAAVNKSASGRALPAVVEYAARLYADEIERLAERYGGPALGWRADAGQILADRKRVSVSRPGAGTRRSSPPPFDRAQGRRARDRNRDAWWISAAVPLMSSGATVARLWTWLRRLRPSWPGKSRDRTGTRALRRSDARSERARRRVIGGGLRGHIAQDMRTPCEHEKTDGFALLRGHR